MTPTPATPGDALRSSPPLLLPAPRRAERGAGWVSLREDAIAWTSSREPHVPGGSPLPAQIACRVTGGWCGAKSVDAQSYRLRIGIGGAAGGVEIEAPGIAGVQHARATLRQLVEQYGHVLPAMDVVDAPVFPTRGVMLDVSRCRIPTMQEFRRIIDVLSDLKCNHLQLYTEHTFAYAGHEGVWRGWEPITPEEAHELGALCKARGIDLAANQNCFGHLAHWLKMPRYSHLAETHGDWVFDVWPRSGPFSLCPTDPASLDFVRDLLGQMLPHFSSSLVNIGCDETYDIAYGRSKDEVAQRGRAAVYLDFVEKVCRVARGHGKRPMFWGDIALSHPECARDIPEDAISLAWGYEPDSPFDRWCEALGSAGREVWVCPGTSSWCSVTGRTTERLANIEKAARDGMAGGATGLLVCDWGDFGHWQQWPVALRGLADGLAAGWTGALPDARSVSLHALSDCSLGAARWLDKLGDVELMLRSVCLGLARPGMSGRLRNQSATFADMRLPLSELTNIGPVHLWIEAMEEVAGHASRPFQHNDVLISQELEFTAHAAAALTSRAVTRRLKGQGDGTNSSHALTFRNLRDEHARLWRARCREGGLSQSCGFFDRVITEFEAAR